MTESEVPPMLKWKENFHLGPQMLYENCQKSTKHPKKLKHDVYNCLFGVELRSTPNKQTSPFCKLNLLDRVKCLNNTY